MNTTLGIDQSFTSTGLVIINDHHAMIDFTTIKSDKLQPKYIRALDVANAICEYYQKYDPANVHIEGLAFGIRGNATRDLAGLQYIILAILYDKVACENVNIISPKSLKLFATGSGKSNKTDMIEAVPEDICKSFKDAGYKKTTGLADLADAFWLAAYEEK